MMSCWTAGCLLWLMFLPLLHAAEKSSLTRFYIVDMNHGGDDDIPSHKLSTILDVRQEGENVRVRTIVVEFAQRCDCMQSDILKVEKILPKTRLTDVAGFDLCALSVANVDRVTQVDQMEEGSLDAEWGTGIVAVCGPEEKLFRIPPSVTNRKKVDSPVRQLLELESKVKDKAFPQAGYDLYSIVSHAPDAQREGEEFVSALRSGEYDAGYWGGTRKTYLDDALVEYYGPRGTKRWVKVRLPDDVRLLRGEKLAYPVLPAQARIQGNVEVSLRAGPETGRVVSRVILSGNPMLAASIADAVAGWQFEPSPALSNPIHVTFEFSLDEPCRVEE